MPFGPGGRAVSNKLAGARVTGKIEIQHFAELAEPDFNLLVCAGCGRPAREAERGKGQPLARAWNNPHRPD